MASARSKETTPRAISKDSARLLRTDENITKRKIRKSAKGALILGDKVCQEKGRNLQCHLLGLFLRCFGANEKEGVGSLDERLDEGKNGKVVGWFGSI